MIEGYSSEQYQEFDKIVNDIIVGTYDTKFKRDWILRMVKRAYDFGCNEKQKQIDSQKTSEAKKWINQDYVMYHSE